MATRKKTPTGVSIRKYPSGREVIRLTFSYNGAVFRETLNIAPTRQNLLYAENLLGSVRLAILKGDFSFAEFFPDSPHAKVERPILGPQIEARMNRLLATGNWQESTYAKRKQAYENHIKPVFGHLTAAEVTPRFVTSWLDSLRGVTNAHTASMLLSLLRPILDEAVINADIERNPLASIRLAALLPTVPSSRRKEAIDPLSMAEITAVLSSCLYPEDAHTFRFALFTGVRRQELPLIRWDNVDFSRNQLLITQAVGLRGQSEYPKPTKTGESRLIDLLPPARAALDAMRPITQLRSEYVFRDPRTDELYTLRALWWHWKEACRRARVRYRPIKQTRHTFCSLMLSRGENIFWVAKQAGHSDLKMMQNHYAKWIDEGGEGYKTRNDWGEAVGTDFTKKSS